VNGTNFRFRFVTCVKEELVNIKLMRMNYVPEVMDGVMNMYHVCGVDRNEAEFIGNKQTNKRTYIQTLNFIY